MGSNITILKDYLNGIADAIRYRGNTTSAIKASDFKTAIRNLPVNIIYNVPTNEETGKPDEIIQVLNSYSPEYASFRDYDGAKITLSGLNTTNITNMQNMFSNCSYITSLNVSDFNTSKVTNMYRMFAACNNLTSLNISNFNGHLVTDIRSMFSGCNKLTRINMANFNATVLLELGANISNLSNRWTIFPAYSESYVSIYPLQSVDMSGFNGNNLPSLGSTFSGQYNLKELNLSNFNGRNITTLSSFLSGCNKLTTLNLTGFNSYNATNHAYAFQGCANLINADFLKNDIHVNLTTNTAYMFNGCSNLASFNYPTFTPYNTTNCYQMFAYCNNMKDINLSSGQFKYSNNMYGMFNNCNQAVSIDVSSFGNWAIPNTNLGYLFSACHNLVTLKWNFDIVNANVIYGMFYNCRNLSTPINFANQDFGASNISSISSMFINCRNLTEINFSNCNGSRLISMNNSSYGNSCLFYQAFNNNATNTFLNFHNFNGSNITNMSYLASHSYVKHIDLTDFNGVKVSNILGMFENAFGLQTVNMSNFGANIIQNIASLFNNCQQLQTIDITNIGNVSGNSLNSMFNNCFSLKNIKGTLDTNNATYFQYMFSNCGLETLDLNWINFSKVNKNSQIDTLFYRCLSKHINFSSSYLNIPTDCRNVGAIFRYCQNLEDVDLSLFTNWISYNKNLSEMFKGCNSLSTINFASWGDFSPSSFSNMYYDCKNLTTLDLGGMDCSNITGQIEINVFRNCNSLRTIKNSFYNFGKNSVQPIHLTYLTSLTEASVMNIVDGLYDVLDAYNRTQYIYLASSVRNNISEDNRAYAREKGWVLA